MDTSTHTSEFPNITAFVHSDEVISFVMKHVDLLIPWSEFQNLPMPNNASPEMMWDVIEFIRLTGQYQQTDLHVLHEGPLAINSWFGISAEMSAILARLVYRGRTSGVLDQQLKQYQNIHGGPLALSADLSAGAARDGIEIIPDALIALTSKTRWAATPQEQLLANAIDILHTLGNYSNRDFDDELYQELQAHLNQGCDNLPYRPLKRPSTNYNVYGSSCEANSPIGYTDKQKRWCMELLKMYAAPLYQQSPDGIVAATVICDLIYEVRPFPRWNGLMEVILRRMLFERLGMSALASIPFSRLLLDWELGLPSTRNLPFAFGQAVLRSHYGYNTTPYLRQLLQFLEQGLNDLEQESLNLVEQIGQCRLALTQDARLNHRQQSLLLDLILHPKSTIDSAAYETRYDVTLVTARADLKNLTQMGFLSLTQVGKKQVFSLAPHMISILLQRN